MKGMTNEQRARNGMMWLLRGTGLTLEEVAEAFGITRERVRTIVSRLDRAIAIHAHRTGVEAGLPAASPWDIAAGLYEHVLATRKARKRDT